MTALVGRDEEWACACGQAYRRVGTDDGIRYWPRSGFAAYSRRGLTADCACIRCGRRLPGTSAPLSGNVSTIAHDTARGSSR